MVPKGFEPEIPVSKRLQTYDLDWEAAGITKLFSYLVSYFTKIKSILKKYNEVMNVGWNGKELWLTDFCNESFGCVGIWQWFVQLIGCQPKWARTHKRNKVIVRLSREYPVAFKYNIKMK